jgi:hypothetical protein
VELSYPNVDDLVGIIKDKGPRCMLFKKDLKRAYRQISVCQGDIHFIGFSWENCLFVDRVHPMGLRSKNYYSCVLHVFSNGIFGSKLFR